MINNEINKLIKNHQIFEIIDIDQQHQIINDDYKNYLFGLVWKNSKIQKLILKHLQFYNYYLNLRDNNFNFQINNQNKIYEFYIQCPYIEYLNKIYINYNNDEQQLQTYNEQQSELNLNQLPINSVTEISINRLNCNQMIVKELLPSSLKSLVIGSCSSKIKSLPSSLHTFIIFDDSFNSNLILPNLILPTTIKNLHFPIQKYKKQFSPIQTQTKQQQQKILKIQLIKNNRNQIKLKLVLKVGKKK